MTKSEAQVQQEIRLQAPVSGQILWRNNNGACFDDTGRLIRYGLAHDSKQINEVFKSSDLIGINPVVITQEMVGRTIGQFFAVEVKPEGWKFPRSTNRKEFERCDAQRNFINEVNRLGGLGMFAQGKDDIWPTR